jgi:CysZ protein
MAPSASLVPVQTARLPSSPGRLRRAAAGAWHVPAGFAFLLRHPRLFPLAALPAALMVLFLAGGIVMGAFLGHLVETRFSPAPGSVPIWLRLVHSTLLIAGTLGATVVLSVGIALALVSPILDQLSRRVEAIARGRAPEHSHGLRFEVLEALRGSFYFLAAAPGVFLLGLIPIVGPLLAVLWAGRALAFQLTDPSLSRRGLTFRQKREWHWRWLAESEGFGLAGMVTLLVPFANLLLGPALAAGGTLLVLSLEELQAPDPVPPDPLLSQPAAL